MKKSERKLFQNKKNDKENSEGIWDYSDIIIDTLLYPLTRYETENKNDVIGISLNVNQLIENAKEYIYGELQYMKELTLKRVMETLNQFNVSQECRQAIRKNILKGE